MKTIFLRSLLVVPVLLLAYTASSQRNLPPGQAAKFGVDGDLKSDERQQGTFAANGSHDWFKKAGGAGIGLIDTTGAAGLKKQISTGANIAFSRKMQFPRYSLQDGVLLMDATYARDYMDNDRTAFNGNSTKNTASPSQWGTVPNGGNVSDKTDILDTYVSMRRNGNVITGNNPSNLMATMALTTLATAGDHYVDFEFYKQRIRYNTVTGSFENSGPASTGGHSVWAFNADGSIKSWGDMTISFSFNSSTVSDIKIMIWVEQSTYQTTKPKNFEFVKNEYHASASVNGYGYAVIVPKGNGNVVAWGTVNSAQTSTPVWGSNSKDLGSNGNGYYADNYSAGQFAEAAVDLTNLGIDPAFFNDLNACNPPFTRFLAKSRSSSSFSSSLSDFSGPYEFLDAPLAPATLLEPEILTCAQSQVNLAPASYLKGAFYAWSTPDGRIVNSNNDSSSVKIDKKGTYYLTAAMAKGCEATMDSVVVPEDRFKPRATATASSPVIFPGGNVLLQGGDPRQSNYPTPFGGSQGLSWSWTGPLEFKSTQQNPLALLPGTYTLTVKESRNGCTDVAAVTIAPGSTLAVKFTDFTVAAGQQQQRNILSWKMADMSEVESFVAEKSSNGTTFSPVGYVFADGQITAYSLKDDHANATSYYRIKALTKTGTYSYSPIIKTTSAAPATGFTAFADAAGVITLQYAAAKTETLSIRILTVNGQLIKSVSRKAMAGTNVFKLSEVERPAKGIYLVLVQGEEAAASVKFNW